MGGAAHRHRLAHGACGLLVGEHDRGGAIGDERAIGALERTGNERILLALAAAEVIAQVLAHLREWVADAVLVVLGRDARQRIGLITVFLKIKRSDTAKDACEAAL